MLNQLANDFLVSVSRDPLTNSSKVALHMANQKVLAWVVIPDDREDIENAFYHIEAELNHKYRSAGVLVDLTIVEECDQLTIPNQYEVCER